MLISNLVNHGTVLLNYRIGDLASYRPEACACGRSLPLLSFLEGRSDDWLRSAAGERVHPQAVRKPISEIGGVMRYQVVQHERTRVDVAVVAAPNADRDAVRARVAQVIDERIGAGTDVRVDFVDDLPRSPSGKVRVVLSRAAAGTGPR